MFVIWSLSMGFDISGAVVDVAVAGPDEAVIVASCTLGKK